MFQYRASKDFAKVHQITDYLLSLDSIELIDLEAHIERLDFVTREYWSGISRDSKYDKIVSMYNRVLSKDGRYLDLKAKISLFMARVSPPHKRRRCVDQAIHYTNQIPAKSELRIILDFYTQFMVLMTTFDDQRHKRAVHRISKIISGSEIEFPFLLLAKTSFYRMTFKYRASVDSFLDYSYSHSLDYDCDHLSHFLESCSLGLSHDINKFLLNQEKIKEIVKKFNNVQNMSARTFVGLNILKNHFNKTYKEDKNMFKLINDTDRDLAIENWSDFFNIAPAYNGPSMFLRELFSLQIRRMLISYLYKNLETDLNFLRQIEREEVERNDVDAITLHNYCLRRMRYPEHSEDSLIQLREILQKAIVASPHRFRRFPKELRSLIDFEMHDATWTQETTPSLSLDLTPKLSWRKVRKNYAIMKADSSQRGRNLDMLLMEVGRLSDGVTISKANVIKFDVSMGRKIQAREVDAVWRFFDRQIHIEANWPEDDIVQRRSKTAEDVFKIQGGGSALGMLVCPSGFEDRALNNLKELNARSSSKIITLDGSELQQIVDEAESLIGMIYRKVAETLDFGEDILVE